MSRTMSQLASDLTDVIGFGITTDKALEWLNERHKIMVVRAEAIKKTLTLDPTDGTGTIVVPPEVGKVLRLRVDGKRYGPVAADSLEDLRTGMAVMPTTSRAYSVEADADGNDTYEIYPTPAAGLVVTLLAAIRPDDLLIGDTPLVPDDFAGALVEGAAATGYAFDPEQTAVADRYEARFDVKCQEYRAWSRRRTRTRGPRQIRVVGRGA